MTGQVHIDIEIAADILEDLLDALARGEMTSIILTREGKPAAKLVPPSSRSASTRHTSSLSTTFSRYSTLRTDTGGTDSNKVGTASEREKAS